MTAPGNPEQIAPTPWHTGEDSAAIFDAAGHRILDVGRSRAHLAERIVRAVNAHEAANAPPEESPRASTAFGVYLEERMCSPGFRAAYEAERARLGRASSGGSAAPDSQQPRDRDRLTVRATINLPSLERYVKAVKAGGTGEGVALAGALAAVESGTKPAAPEPSCPDCGAKESDPLRCDSCRRPDPIG